MQRVDFFLLCPYYTRVLSLFIHVTPFWLPVEWWLLRIHRQYTGPLFYFTAPQATGVHGVMILKGKLTHFTEM